MLGPRRIRQGICRHKREDERRKKKSRRYGLPPQTAAFFNPVFSLREKARGVNPFFVGWSTQPCEAGQAGLAWGGKKRTKRLT